MHALTAASCVAQTQQVQIFLLDTRDTSELDARRTPDLFICKLAFGLLSRRWGATEDQMPAAMRLPPPIADRPRKLSLRERMTMHLPHASPPQPLHLTSHESAAQPSGQPHAALPATSPGDASALASAKAACDHGRHQQSLPSCSAAEHSNGAASHSTTAAAERSARAGSVSDACLASGDASDEDLTQEDLPALSLPSNSQEEHGSPVQGTIQHEGPSAAHLHDRHVDRKLQMAEQEPDQQIASGSRTAHDHLYRQQQRQQQQQQERLCMPDDKECGQKQGAASACREQQDMSKVQHPDKIESQVINLEDESADDLLDALADAAAEVPEAADDATDEGYELPDMLLQRLSIVLMMPALRSMEFSAWCLEACVVMKRLELTC